MSLGEAANDPAALMLAAPFVTCPNLVQGLE
jgi:hypothetical protein